ncbi:MULTISPECIES: hypothetical protein [unclassified Streptomyces]|uniref:hypothetical protein n=1 Tax=unclassified Streptomyces TaxID=2593676 RepID=UPI002DDA9EE4|nr:hypothetical protein [Streptomyces sp. NBC_01795]WSA97775.1 hypothetical protein OIE63_40525 [Streptomyces sp. NBC_01795]WSS46708.1 hypothetical protein OG220_39695 [Streptomyces sp. NBC_01187]WSS47075.1 hypothetical protein OG220_41930 [Streptomyces sp. NBC_01187]
MTRDSRNGTPRRDGSVRWTVPGAEAVVTAGRLCALAAHAGVTVSLDGERWEDAPAAQIIDEALRLVAAPEAAHMTRTTEPRGWYHPTDARRGMPGSAGLNRPGGKSGLMRDGGSWAHCSCGWSTAHTDRQAARWAAKRHRADFNLP